MLGSFLTAVSTVPKAVPGTLLMLREYCLSEVIRSVWERHTCRWAGHPPRWLEGSTWLSLSCVTRERHTKCPLYACAKYIILVSIGSGPGKGLRAHGVHAYLQVPLQPAPSRSPARSRSRSRSSDSHLMAWSLLLGAQHPKHHLPMWPPGSSSDESTGTPGTRHLSLAVAVQPGRRGRRREVRQRFRRLRSPALPPSLPLHPQNTYLLQVTGHLFLLVILKVEGRQGHRDDGVGKTQVPCSRHTHLPKPSKKHFQLPPSQRPLCQHWAQGWGHRLHTFLVSEGLESCDGCLGLLGFWACLLQARGFVGSPKDLQNSTCMGKSCCDT